MGQPGVPELDAYIVENLKENDTVGFDGRVMNTKDAWHINLYLIWHT